MGSRDSSESDKSALHLTESRDSFGRRWSHALSPDGKSADLANAVNAFATKAVQEAQSLLPLCRQIIAVLLIVVMVCICALLVGLMWTTIFDPPHAVSDLPRLLAGSAVARDMAGVHRWWAVPSLATVSGGLVFVVRRRHRVCAYRRACGTSCLRRRSARFPARRSGGRHRRL